MESSCKGSLLQYDVVNHFEIPQNYAWLSETHRFGAHWAHLVGQKPKGHVVLV